MSKKKDIKINANIVKETTKNGIPYYYIDVELSNYYHKTIRLETAEIFLIYDKLKNI